MIFATR